MHADFERSLASLARAYYIRLMFLKGLCITSGTFHYFETIIVIKVDIEI